MAEDEVTWRPQPGPQTAFVHCTWASEILFGGARGGGKTDAALGRFLIKALQFKGGMKGIFFRRTMPELEDVISRSQEIFGPFAKYNETRKTWKFHNGATVKMRYLEADRDAQLYQGQSNTDIAIEEAGNFPSQAPIMKLKATLRSAKGVPTSLILTANPGGVGAHWVKARYIDPAPLGYKPIVEVDARTGTQETRTFIPSKVWDNKILLNNDPGYIARLAQSGSEQLVKAWLDGNWNVVDGAYFPEWDEAKHVLPACEIPPWFMRFRAMDWGSYRPYACYWIAVASDDWQHPISGVIIPKGALIVYRELYGISRKLTGELQTNIGVRLSAGVVASHIMQAERGDIPVTYGVLDPSAFSVDGGPSIAEMMFRGSDGKVAFRRADNKRIGPAGALSGWDQVRGRLAGELDPATGRPGRPMLYVFSTCEHLIRTLPVMQHDPDRPEDLQTDSEDHAVDALRYGCMSRPFIRPMPESKRPPRTLQNLTLEELWYDHSSRQAPEKRL